VSRAHNAGRKAKRQQARATAAERAPARRTWPRRSATLVPVLLIVAILAVVGILGFGASSGVSNKQVRSEVAQLLEGIPQRGAVLGSPRAPLTVQVYADLECPTVRLFVENHLPAFIDNWVRTGSVRLEYRSFQTDTADEAVFFSQEIAALAAGRQNRMWNFLLTFVRQQGEVRTDYVTETFLTGIGAQVPGLNLAEWRQDRKDAGLSKRVALSVHSGRTGGVVSTPSLLVDFTDERNGDRPAAGNSAKAELETSLESLLETLRQESREDFPTLVAPEQGATTN
jgi:hypothetical protein